MDPFSIAAYAIQALDLIPKVIAAGRDVQAYIDTSKGVISTAQGSGQKIPSAAWDELKTVREALQAELHS